jgi:hypothetical protein
MHYKKKIAKSLDYFSLADKNANRGWAFVRMLGKSFSIFEPPYLEKK